MTCRDAAIASTCWRVTSSGDVLIGSWPASLEAALIRLMRRCAFALVTIRQDYIAARLNTTPRG